MLNFFFSRLSPVVIVCYLGMHFIGLVQAMPVTSPATSESSTLLLQQLLQQTFKQDSPAFLHYQKLRKDPQFLQSLRNLNLQSLDLLNWNKLSVADQQELLTQLQQLQQQPSLIADPSQQETWQQSSQPAQQALAISSQSLRDLPTLAVQTQYLDSVKEQVKQLSQGTRKLLTTENLPVEQLCEGNRTLACTLTRISEGNCLAQPLAIEVNSPAKLQQVLSLRDWSSSNGFALTAEQRQQLQENLSAQQRKLSLVNLAGSYSCGEDCFARDYTVVGNKGRYRLKGKLPSSLLKGVKVKLVQHSGQPLSVGSAKYLSEQEYALPLDQQGNFQLTLQAPHNQAASSLKVSLRFYSEPVQPLTVIDWQVKACPWQALQDNYQFNSDLAALKQHWLAELNQPLAAASNKLNPQPNFSPTRAESRLSKEAEFTPSYQVDCLDEPLSLPAEASCLSLPTAEGSVNACKILNLNNPYFKGRKLFCGQVKLSWLKLSSIANNCRSKLQSLASKYSDLSCELQASSPLLRSSVLGVGEESPEHLKFSLPLREQTKLGNSGEKLSLEVGQRLEYHCQATNLSYCVSKPRPLQTFYSQELFADCPQETKVEEVPQSIQVTEDHTCSMGHNCPDFLTYSGNRISIQSAWRDYPDLALPDANPSLRAGEANLVEVAPNTTNASGLNATVGESESDSATGAATTAEIISLQANCQVITSYQAQVHYRCSHLTSYPRVMVKKISKCKQLQCQLQDGGCDRLQQAQDLSKVVQATSIMQAMQGEAKCNPQEGSCQLFAGKAFSCRCSLGGVVDCCHLPSRANLGDYLALTFKLLQLNDSLHKLSGKTNPIGSWSSLTEVIGSGFSKLGELVEQPLTSALESVVGNTTSLGTALGSSGANAVGSATVGATEAGALVSSGLLDRVKQALLASVEEWLSETFGKELAEKIIVNQGGKLGLSSGVSQVFNFATGVYSAYQAGLTAAKIVYSCNEHELELSQKRGLRACHTIGIRCSQRIAGKCVQTTEMTCCFSSPLTRILQQQIRKQLGIGFGTVENPDCRALSMEQLAQVNWKQVDLSEWLAILLNQPQFKDLNQRLVEQKTLLARAAEQEPRLAQLIPDLDQQGTLVRNQTRIAKLNQNLSLDFLVEQAKPFLTP